MKFSLGNITAEIDIYDEDKRHIGRGTANLSDALINFNHHVQVPVEIQHMPAHKKLPCGVVYVRAMVTECHSLIGKCCCSLKWH
jgi:hypothetical protein